MANLLEIIIVGLAAYRISVFVGIEDGFYSKLTILRDWLSSSGSFANEILLSITCMWCMNTLFSIVLTVVINGLSLNSIISALASSIIAMYVHKKIGG